MVSRWPAENDRNVRFIRPETPLMAQFRRLEQNTSAIRHSIRCRCEGGAIFLGGNAGIRKAKGNRYIPLSTLLVLDTQREADEKSLTELARDHKGQGLCDGMDAMEVFTRLEPQLFQR